MYKKKRTDLEILNEYKKTKSIWVTGKNLGISGQTVHERLVSIGFNDFKNRPISPAEISAIIKWYNHTDFNELGLDPLVEKLGRTKQLICRTAGKLGLTDKKRKESTKTREKMSNTWIEWHKNNPHPRGMLGKNHTPETRNKFKKILRNRYKTMPFDTKFKIAQKALKTKYFKYGTLATMRTNVSWKGGWREIGGYKKYYRSRWEANYARYLEFQKINGLIKDWKHEPQIFWFEGIRRGTTNYTPDFKVTLNDDTHEWHEVKGWMDARSITKIKRMAKYHPKEILIIRDSKWFRDNSKMFKSLAIQFE